MNNAQHERGVGLIIVVIVVAFLLVVGLMLASITRTGVSIASNIRLQEQAFNAAEAGFNAAWTMIEENFIASGWTDFSGHCLETPSNVADPGAPEYFRKLTDEDFLNTLNASTQGVLFYKQLYVPAGGAGFDQRYSYTVFLVEDDGASGAPDPSDAFVICIGTVQTGETLTTARLEVGLAMQNTGANP